VAFRFTFPIIAASVSDKTGSEIPEISAGMANLLMFFRLIEVFIDSIQYGFNVIQFDWVNFKTV
jgi:hypothetical protein